MLYIRKNRNALDLQKKICNSDNYGVDLNRNYGYMWGYNDLGSTGWEDVCRDDYRGPSAFSEPETRAIRDLIEKWANIKIAINLHAYGNMLVVPFNYDDQVNAKLNSEFPNAAALYD